MRKRILLSAIVCLGLSLAAARSEAESPKLKPSLSLKAKMASLRAQVWVIKKLHLTAAVKLTTFNLLDPDTHVRRYTKGRLVRTEDHVSGIPGFAYATGESIVDHDGAGRALERRLVVEAVGQPTSTEPAYRYTAKLRASSKTPAHPEYGFAIRPPGASDFSRAPIARSPNGVRPADVFRGGQLPGTIAQQYEGFGAFLDTL